MDEPHFLSQDTDHGSLDLQLSSRLPRSLAECAVPFPCTPVLYFSTTTVGPSETASFDKFPLGTGDSLVCDSTSSSIITLGGFKANCRKVVQDVIFDYASPDGYRKRRVDKKVVGVPFTVFEKKIGGSSWTGRKLADGEHTLQVTVRGAGACNLWNTTYRFRVTKTSICVKVQKGPCAFVDELPNLPKQT